MLQANVEIAKRSIDTFDQREDDFDEWVASGGSRSIIARSVWWSRQ